MRLAKRNTLVSFVLGSALVLLNVAVALANDVTVPFPR